MKREIVEYLEKQKKVELKWMYGLDIEDVSFGVETYLYQLCVRVLEGRTSLENMISTLVHEYGEDYYVVRDLEELVG